MADLFKHNRTVPSKGEDDEEDPVERMIKKTGCLEKHYEVQECMAEHQDWRKCQNKVNDFRQCMSDFHKKDALHKKDTLKKQ